MTPTNDPLRDAALRRIADAKSIKSPAELGITPDRRRNGRRAPRSVKHKAIR